MRQRIQCRLAVLLLEQKAFPEALSLVKTLSYEVKKLDDKQTLVEVYLTESRIYHAIGNLPKSSAALTSSRTAANSIYVPPAQQAEIDMQAGILYADSKDYRTSYSYFFEAFENYSNLATAGQRARQAKFSAAEAAGVAATATVTTAAVDQNRTFAVQALKYMLLCKIMEKKSDDVTLLINGKHGLKYACEDLQAMSAIASAQRARSLQAFQAANEQYKTILGGDELVNRHLTWLYDSMLEQNLCRILEPFSCVEIGHVATLINLPLEVVEAKLSQMILDEKFRGILDQGAGHLIVYEDETGNTDAYKAGLDVISSMGKVVDTLSRRAVHLK